jgi:hypothetical protein
VRRAPAGLCVTGDKREEVGRRAGRNNALPKDMMDVWMLDLRMQAIRLAEYAGCHHGSFCITVHYKSLQAPRKLRVSD